jgi:hypothetical protein
MFELNTIVALPFLADSRTRFHSCSLTRALTCPTKTPGSISKSHFVKSPRNDRGQFVSEITIISFHPPKYARNLL